MALKAGKFGIPLLQSVEQVIYGVFVVRGFYPRVHQPLRGRLGVSAGVPWRNFYRPARTRRTLIAAHRGKVT
jgi:hypothetical protein